MPKFKSPTLSKSLAMLFVASMVAPSAAKADGYAGYNCNDLWFARNDLYANKGHCFKSQKGRANYPNSCFPPFGKLNSFEQNEVNKIKREERRLRC